MMLNDDERKVLGTLAMAHCGGLDFAYLSFAPIVQDTGLDRKRVRRACRKLKRKGLAEYGKGLSTADGQFYGAGYCVTEAGVKLWTDAPEGEDVQEERE